VNPDVLLVRLSTPPLSTVIVGLEANEPPAARNSLPAEIVVVPV
jgi:hypothetical protein